ncbi:MAG: hypothetical protein O3A19_04550, partial [Planctomycetota bacterium]|nr:hypothetical protein [Planctomycetota bacterium]
MPNQLRVPEGLFSLVSYRDGVLSTGLAVAMVVGAGLLGGCATRLVKVEMQAGTEGPERVFETNRTDRDEITRLSDTYEAPPLDRIDGKNGVRFEGAFAEHELPSEIGNRNGWSSLPGTF